MGQQVLDQFSLLHFSTGVLAYFWGISFYVSVLLHIFFEWLENTETGMMFINLFLAGIWPGGKPRADSLRNMIGDTLVFAAGWLVAMQLDWIGINRRWY
jgi:hypothetical protein